MVMKKYSDEDLIDILVELAVEIGRTPRMKDLLEKKGGPYPSLYQSRFASKEGYQDGWNNAIKKAGLDYNRKKVDQNKECMICGIDGHTQNGRLIRWKGGDQVICMACYQRLYYRDKVKTSTE